MHDPAQTPGWTFEPFSSYELFLTTGEERFAMYLSVQLTQTRGLKVRHEWKNYFEGTYSPLQLKLIGISSQNNGDIRQALKHIFSPVY